MHYKHTSILFTFTTVKYMYIKRTLNALKFKLIESVLLITKSIHIIPLQLINCIISNARFVNVSPSRTILLLPLPNTWYHKLEFN